MKMKLEFECTPEEARRFFGLPDVTAMNEQLVAEMRKRLDPTTSLFDPEALMRSWSTLGGQAQNQFRDLLSAVRARSGAGGRAE